jgi:hypothetical protein
MHRKNIVEPKIQHFCSKKLHAGRIQYYLRHGTFFNKKIEMFDFEFSKL